MFGFSFSMAPSMSAPYASLMPLQRCPLCHLCVCPLGPLLYPLSPCTPLACSFAGSHLVPSYSLLTPNAPSRGFPLPPAQPGAPQMQEVQELARGARSRAEEALGRSQAARGRAEKATAQLRDFIRRIKAFLAGRASTAWAHGHGKTQQAHPKPTVIPCPHRGGS